MTYTLLDSGDQKKYEQWGEYRTIRPCAQAVWRPQVQKWEGAHFDRDEGWSGKLPKQWEVTLEDLKFLLRATDFGHLGLFPEHSYSFPPGKKALNLFAYTGRTTLKLAKAGYDVTHVDASKKSVAWAKENADLNGIGNIRWIVEDARKFLAREARRENKYDVIVLDPPSFGRGPNGEVFKLEEEIVPLLKQCSAVARGSVTLTSHTPGWTPTVLSHLLTTTIGGKVDAKELLIPSDTLALPSGSFATIHLPPHSSTHFSSPSLV